MADLSTVRAGAVHVWHGTVERPGDWPGGPSAADLACLSEQERARCRALGKPADQRRFAAAHAGVRRILAGYLETAGPAIRFGRVPCCRCGDTRHGRPRVDWPRTDITFSLSHAGDHWLVAVSRGRPVGVDVELASGADISLLARTCLSPAELAYLQAHDGAGREHIFYTCWLRKEAVLKACGIGLAVPPSSVEVAPERSPRARVAFACAAGPRDWLVDDLAGQRGRAGHRTAAGPAAWLGAVAQPAAGAGQVLLRATAESFGRDGPGDRAAEGSWAGPAGRPA
jgi:4'-phosphopantetheinyl transferase